MIRRSDMIASMTDASDHSAILRMVALTAVEDARAAWRAAQVRPSEESVRAALRLCVLATRALRRASTGNPDEEDEMLDRAALLAETSAALNRDLARLVET